MGVLADSNGKPRSGDEEKSHSGFNGLLDDGTSYTAGIAFPTSEYYDLYMTESSSTACNGGICYGHALSETARWYSDYPYFVSSTGPWFERGSKYSGGAYAGAFYSNEDGGHAKGRHSWHSVLVAR